MIRYQLTWSSERPNLASRNTLGPEGFSVVSDSVVLNVSSPTSTFELGRMPTCMGTCVHVHVHVHACARVRRHAGEPPDEHRRAGPHAYMHVHAYR